ncbi:MAG: helix-turn-helix domain-containing protein [Muribaculaceae bacterium]|nr:helix-turn-helix domain-containing protein [Muribaculaceae bacterium]
MFLNYSSLHLPETLNSILEQDFWLLESIGPQMLRSLSEPVKFAASTYIIVLDGCCKAEINLVDYDIKAPTLVSIMSSHIMQPFDFSDDFKAAVFVMSKKFSDNVFLNLNGTPLQQLSTRHPVTPIPPETLDDYKEFITTARKILNEKSNPYASQAMMHHVMMLFYRTIYKAYDAFSSVNVNENYGRLCDNFLILVQKHFRDERFLDYYADALGVSTKHLSRTVRAQTGSSAADWIERFLILEAKVLLKSSNLNIQQISDELNFRSQSFFGKYFKHHTGLTPTEFRNG